MFSAVNVKLADAKQGVSRCCPVADVAIDVQRVVLVLEGQIWLSHNHVDLPNHVESVSDTFFLAQAARNVERLLIITQGLIRLAETGIGGTEKLKDQGPLFLVIDLDVETLSAVQGLETILVISAVDLHSTDRHHSIDVLRIELQHFLIVLPSIGEIVGILVTVSKRQLNIGIVR